jgi:hypothetical protein
MARKSKGTSNRQAQQAKSGSNKPTVTPHPDEPQPVQEKATGQEPTLEERAAYHEAGHFVAAMHLRRKVVRSISIVPDDEQGILGVVNFGKVNAFFEELEYADSEDPELLHDLIREIILCLAGEAAEVVFFGEAAKGGSAEDRESAMALATRMFPLPGEAEAFVAWLRYRADYVVGLRINRSRIDALAQALLERKKVSVKQAKQVVESAVPEVTRLVKAINEGARKLSTKKQ